MKHGWPLKEVGELFDVQLGKMLSPKAREGEQFPYLANFNVQWGKFNLGNVKSMHFTESEKEKYSLKPGDLLMCEGGEVGRCAIWNERSTNFYYQNALHRLRPKNKNTINPYFMCIYIEHIAANNGLAKTVGKTSIAHLTREKLCALKIPCPSKEQQDKIVKAISTWDAAIEKTERLIAAKERLFKWLLKRLIIDQQNNPRWHKMKLGNLCAKILGGGTPSTANVSYWKGHIPWMTSADIVNAKTINARKYITDQAVTDSATNLIPRNNIIVVTRVGLGKAVKNEMDICISQDSQGLILKKSVSADFLIHCLLEKIKVFKSSSQGSTIQGIIKKRLFDIEVSLPSLPQQKQIAQQLDIVEQEIGLLKQLTEKYCTQKRGLMQKLLTGEWMAKA